MCSMIIVVRDRAVCLHKLRQLARKHTNQSRANREFRARWCTRINPYSSRVSLKSTPYNPLIAFIRGELGYNPNDQRCRNSSGKLSPRSLRSHRMRLFRSRRQAVKVESIDIADSVSPLRWTRGRGSSAKRARHFLHRKLGKPSKLSALCASTAALLIRTSARRRCLSTSRDPLPPIDRQLGK